MQPGIDHGQEQIVVVGATGQPSQVQLEKRTALINATWSRFGPAMTRPKPLIDSLGKRQGWIAVAHTNSQL